MSAKLNTERFIEKSIAKHGDKYDYSKSIYINNLSIVTITCKKHGDFTQRASNHMIGVGCRKCSTDNAIERLSMSQDEFVRIAKKVHGNTYDYSKSIYTRTNKKVEIGCIVHGSFWQKPNAHISNESGCPKCAGKSLTTDEFIDKLKAVHGDKYSYNNVNYTTIKSQIEISCKQHGAFTQTADGHLAGRGCNQCWYESYASQAEKEIADWIESLGIEIKRNNRDSLQGKFEIDILIPAANIGIEFNGRYWHSDRKQKNYRQQEFKHEAAKKAGIRIITVWDYEWEEKQEIVKNIIKNALGKNEAERINARACEVIEISSTEANSFYDKNHIQGGCRGSIINIALKSKNETVAVMSFTKGGTRRGKLNDWELARYATSKNVRGGASRLFTGFLRLTGAEKVWSFSDNQHFSGEIYKTLGFTNDGKLNADYKVIHYNKNIVWHKSLWQRKSIPKRLKELGINEEFLPDTDTRSERDMQGLAKVLRIWDSGKTRWLFTTTSQEPK